MVIILFLPAVIKDNILSRRYKTIIIIKIQKVLGKGLWTKTTISLPQPHTPSQPKQPNKKQKKLCVFMCVSVSKS